MSIHADPTRGPPRAITDNSSATQIVHSVEEGNALVLRLKQLEAENLSLTHTLSKVCDENATLSGQLVAINEKVAQLAQAPLASTSLLHSLFEPEKTGWFGGSKSAAREQLEQLASALQAEFLGYKAAHASSNDEVQALLDGLHAVHTNSAHLSKVSDQQQQIISEGPLAVTVRVVQVDDRGNDFSGGGTALVEELERDRVRLREYISELSTEVKQLKVDLANKGKETMRLQTDLNESRAAAAVVASASGTSAPAAAVVTRRVEVEAQKARDENTRLRGELQQLRDTLATEERLHTIKRQESEDLARRVEELTRTHEETLQRLRQEAVSGTGSAGVSASASLAAASAPNGTDSGEQCQSCKALRRELQESKQRAAAAQQELQATKARLLETTTALEKNIATLQAQLLECHTNISQKDSVIARSVPAEQLSKLDLERNATLYELNQAKERIAHLEATTAAGGAIASEKSAGSALHSVTKEGSVDAVEVLAMLERNKERMARFEFEAEQLRLQVDQAKSYAVSRDEEARRLDRASQEDRQRISFLLKKCAAATAEQREAAAARDAALEDVKRHQLEVKRLGRAVEEVPPLQEKLSTMQREKQLAEERLAATAALEEKLVKAKETIAYMELAQSRSINMSQYAELEAERDKLTNTMSPLRTKLEEANKELQRLRAVTEAQQTVSATQQNSVHGWQERVNELTASEEALRDQLATVQTEYERLQKVNGSLELQMTSMHDGIREMAMQNEKERTNAKTAAEANALKEVTALKEQLKQAQDTIGSVEATKGQFVAEGLYQAAVSERDKLQEDLKRKAYDIEKLKSEILIYRQTVADLEAENDEHVHEAETRQERHQSENTSLQGRLGAEQSRSQELENDLELMKETLAKRDAQIELHNGTIHQLEERQEKQKRAFESKCQSEESLRDELQKIRQEAETLRRQVEEGRAATKAAEAVTVSRTEDRSGSVNGVTAPESAELERTVAALREELERNARTAASRAEVDKKLISALRVQVMEKTPVDSKVAYEAEVARSRALSTSNDVVVRENEVLRLRLSTLSAAAGAAQGRPTLYDKAALTQGNATDLQMSLLEAQKQLAAQRETFTMAMERAVGDVELHQSRVLELEAKLEEQTAALEQLGERSHMNLSVEAESSPLGKPVAAAPPKKRVKKVKRGKTLSEQLDAGVDEMDVLGATRGPGDAGDESAVSPDGMTATVEELRRTQAQLSRTQRELDILRGENMALKETIAQLTADVQRAMAEVEALHNQQEVKRAGLDRDSAGAANVAAAVHVDTIAAMERENATLRTEVARLQRTVSTDVPVAAPASPLSADVKALRRQIRDKDAEIHALSSQLLPAKDKLVEYMALTDRLGIEYPFPPELEGTTVVRLKSMMPGRALSAPHPPVKANVKASPTPRKPGRQRAAPTSYYEEEPSLL